MHERYGRKNSKGAVLSRRTRTSSSVPQAIPKLFAYNFSVLPVLHLAERRKHERTPFVSRTEVSWSSDEGELTIPGMIEDKSISGLGIHTAKPIPPGTWVKVKFRDQMLLAVVRRCIKVPLGFLIGVSFEQEPLSSVENPAETDHP